VTKTAGGRGENSRADARKKRENSEDQKRARGKAPTGTDGGGSAGYHRWEVGAWGCNTVGITAVRDGNKRGGDQQATFKAGNIGREKPGEENHSSPKMLSPGSRPQKVKTPVAEKDLSPRRIVTNSSRADKKLQTQGKTSDITAGKEDSVSTQKTKERGSFYAKGIPANGGSDREQGDQHTTT